MHSWNLFFFVFSGSFDYRFCEGKQKPVHFVDFSSDRAIKGVIYSPHFGSFGKAGDSELCELNIITNVKGQYYSITYLELITTKDDMSPALCLLDLIAGNDIVEGNCNKAKVRSGVTGITLELNNISQPLLPTFNISYKGRSLKCQRRFWKLW